MNSTFDRLANPWLNDVRPYVPGLTAAEASARYGLPLDGIVKLSSNENPLGPPRLAIERIERLFPDLNRYADSSAHEIRRYLAAIEGLNEENVMIGAGSSEIMSFIVRAFSRPGDEILSMEPSFDVYSEIATAEGRIPVRIPLTDPFELTLDQVREHISERTRVIFITRPNNPTSRISPLSILLEISRLAERAVVVSDEAYIEFADDYRRLTGAVLVMGRPNLIVTRTFSKAYGLANLRVGYALGRPEAVGYLMKIKPKWNVGDLAQQAAIGALLDTEHLERTLATVRGGRAFLIEEFNRLSLTVVPGSQANFVMASVKATSCSAAEFTDRMGMHGVIIRGDFHPDFVRVSVGTAAENEAAVRAAKLIVGRP